MGSDDAEWKKAAMADDGMVAELLLRLSQAGSNTAAPEKPCLSLEWRVRQRRSKVAVNCSKHAPTAAAASPTTPLSWSGGATSHSGGGGGGCVDAGSEESSKPDEPVPDHPMRLETSRSNKLTINEPSTNKRARRKKTLAELREEESFLLQERKQLKKELADLRVDMEKQKATNEDLKRMKLDLPSRLVDDASFAPSPPKACSEVQKDVITSRYQLPDLNLALEEDCNAEVLCGPS